MGVQDIIKTATELAGLDAPPANAAQWAKAVINDILIYTRRTELPQQLDLVAAQILAEVFKQDGNSGAVQSIREGDTTITFAGMPEANAAWERYKPQLMAFRKLTR